MRLFLRLVLETEGYDVLLAANGRQGLRLLQVHAADVVITDILMPEQDGFEVMTALRRHLPTMRIIAISGGSADFDCLDVAHKLGAHRTLKKPFVLSDLLTAIRQDCISPQALLARTTKTLERDHWHVSI